MKSFSYKETKNTTLKVTGVIDTDMLTIDVDGYSKKLATLLSDFNGAVVELVVKVKEENELDEPTEN